MEQGKFVVSPGKLSVVEASLSCSGSLFLLSLAKNFIRKNSGAHVILLNSSPIGSNAVQLLESTNCQDVEFTPGTSDNSSLHDFLIETITKDGRNTETVLLIVRNLNDFLFAGSAAEEKSLMVQLSLQLQLFIKKKMTILAGVHSDLLICPHTLSCFQSVANAWYSLTASNDLLVCRSRIQRYQGRPLVKTDYISINAAALEFDKVSPVGDKKSKLTGSVVAPVKKPEPKKAPDLPSIPVPFKMGISEKEQESKESVPLPYTSIINTGKESMFVGIRRDKGGTGEGKVVYTADAEDDLDDSDPDDDLNV